jgi:hypothetical protein
MSNFKAQMTNQIQILKAKCQKALSGKILLFAFLISIFLLSGCFGYFKKKETPKSAAPEMTQTQTPTSGETSQAEIPEPPSFQDGDYYLQALSSKNGELCGKIRNPKLKERCETKVKEN